jgi:hypothetical protein
LRVTAIAAIGFFGAIGMASASCGGAAETDLFAESDGGAGSSGGGSPSGDAASSGDGASGDGSFSSGGPPDASIACTVGQPGACAGGSYCAGACGEKGTCTAIPAESTKFEPVCGCDGVVYWNGGVAASFGQSAHTTEGSCVLVTCNAQKACPDGLRCGMRRDSVAQCGGSTNGVCWGLPKSCPKLSDPESGPPTRACGALGCTSLCDAIEDEKPFYAATPGSCR